MTVVPALLTDLRHLPECAGYFFIRYRDPDDHIRFRLRVHDGCEDAMRERIEERLRVTRENEPVLRDHHWIPYVPEYERYGGSAGVTVAESFFEASSDLAIALLSDERVCAGRDARLGRGLIAMVLVVHAMTGGNAERASMLLTRYGAALAPRPRADTTNGSESAAYVHEAWSRCASGDIGMPFFDPFYRATCAAKHALSGVRFDRATQGSSTSSPTGELSEFVCMSYSHMTSNRLGITPAEEAHVASLCGWAMSSYK